MNNEVKTELLRILKQNAQNTQKYVTAQIKSIKTDLPLALKVNGTALPVAADGSVELPLATAMSHGLVKGSDAENGVMINADGTMEVGSLNVNRLVQTMGEELVFCCGDADDDN